MSDKVTVFSNGTEFMVWSDFNCCQCARSVQVTDPGGTMPPTCPIEYALLIASIGDGLVTPEIKARMNYDLIDGRHRCGEFERLREFPQVHKGARDALLTKNADKEV